MTDKNDTILQEATRVLDLISKDRLTAEDKDQIVKDSIEYFNAYVNPGWLRYRKSISAVCLSGLLR